MGLWSVCLDTHCGEWFYLLYLFKRMFTSVIAIPAPLRRTVRHLTLDLRRYCFPIIRVLPCAERIPYPCLRTCTHKYYNLYFLTPFPHVRLTRRPFVSSSFSSSSSMQPSHCASKSSSSATTLSRSDPRIQSPPLFPDRTQMALLLLLPSTQLAPSSVFSIIDYYFRLILECEYITFYSHLKPEPQSNR